jgi:GAF domain-containing protein
MLDREADVSDVIRRPSRLRALAELGANAESAAEALDRIGQIACRVLEVPVALVNLVGDDQQHFVGCAADEPWRSTRRLPLTVGFCPFAVGTGDTFTLDDARADPAMAVNPAVEQFGVVAYAGVPLRSPDGEAIGTLCAIDYEARTWRPDDLALLTALAAAVIAELQLLTATRLLARQETRLRTLTDLTSALAPAESPRDVVGEVSRTVHPLDARAVWLSVLDGQTLRTAAVEPEELAGRLDLPVSAEVARSGEPRFLSTRAELPELSDALPEVGTAAIVALTAGDSHLGVLGMCFAGERPLSSADREYLTALGGISALALSRGLQ